MQHRPLPPFLITLISVLSTPVPGSLSDAFMILVKAVGRAPHLISTSVHWCPAPLILSPPSLLPSPRRYLRRDVRGMRMCTNT